MLDQLDQMSGTRQPAPVPAPALPAHLNRPYPLVVTRDGAAIELRRPAGSCGWAVFVSVVDDDGTVLVVDAADENRYWEARFDPDRGAWIATRAGERLVGGEVVETYPLDVDTRPLTEGQRSVLDVRPHARR